MSVLIALFCAENMPHVTIPLVRINALVIQDGQAMDKTAQTLTSVHWDCTFALRTHIAQITKVVIRVRAIKGGSVSGLNHTAGVPGVTLPRSVLDMVSACGMARVIVLAITAEQTAQCAMQKCGAQAMECATSMERVIVKMAGLDNRWTVVFVSQMSCVVVTEHVTTTLRRIRIRLVSAMTTISAVTAAKVGKYLFLLSESFFHSDEFLMSVRLALMYKSYMD